LDELVAESEPYPVSVYGVPVRDTCKEVVDGLVRRTVPRESLVVARGPWVFSRQALAEALSAVAGREAEIPDLIGFCETTRVRVRVLPVR
jgi:2-C-methyl-D-erythritol 4-phosphate cytidylyltransferase